MLEDLRELRVTAVYKDGVLTAREGVCLGAGNEKGLCSGTGEKPQSGIRKDTSSAEKTISGLEAGFPRVFDSFRMDEITLENLVLEQKRTMERVIQLRPQKDIVKAAMFERHLHTGHRGLGFVGGYGLKKGAVATSVAHDSHNLIVVGTNDRDMVLAANTVW